MDAQVKQRFISTQDSQWLARKALTPDDWRRWEYIEKSPATFHCALDLNHLRRPDGSAYPFDAASCLERLESAGLVQRTGSGDVANGGGRMVPLYSSTHASRPYLGNGVRMPPLP